MSGQRFLAPAHANRYTDPRQGQFGVALQAHAAVEAGCATFSVERPSYVCDELARETTVSVGWLLPTRRLRSARHELRKPVTDGIPPTSFLQATWPWPTRPELFLRAAVGIFG